MFFKTRVQDLLGSVFDHREHTVHGRSTLAQVSSLDEPHQLGGEAGDDGMVQQRLPILRGL